MQKNSCQTRSPQAHEKLNLPDKNVQDLYLNISGTIVKTKGKIEFFPSQAEEALDVLVYGGELREAYRFSKNTQTKPVQVERSEPLQITTGKSEKDKTWLLLQSIQTKILEEGQGEKKALTAEEKNLIQETHFPISSLLVLMGQWQGSNVEKHVSLLQCAEIIAFEKVAGYIEKVIKTLLVQSEVNQSIQVETDTFQSFKEGLEKALVLIERRKLENYQKMAVKHQLMQDLIQYEKMLRNKPEAAL